MNFLKHPDGVRFHVVDNGKGIPLVFQHGLGGSVQQAVELFDSAPGIRLLSMDCRGHGSTEEKPPRFLQLGKLVADLEWFIRRNVDQPVYLGGVSLGALLAVKVALVSSHPILGLILLRPAWPHPDCATDFNALGKTTGYSKFSQLFAPDGGVDSATLERITHRVLVIGMPNDPLHPEEFAFQISRLFPNGIYKQAPSKAHSLSAYANKVREHVFQFIGSI